MTLAYHTPLSTDEQHRLGISPPQPLAMADQVRFSELDALNHVNNAVYMEWFERLRVRYVQEIGISGYDRTNDPRIVIRSGSIHYIQEMRMDENYVVTCGCSAFRNTSFSLNQQLWSGGTKRAQFDCIVVLLTPDGSGRMAIPDAVRQRFTDIDHATSEG
ncbi:thioesterase [Sulfitobacter sp. SK012]|uniref:acyl-CoA thioesterase n=1 Tax=Sulfitobacter sp. SK012 TaxID=1389005 RepID=UPI000E0B4F23|nr:thioesterase family protein [Sulfitobacter sp. SK012]AXI46747.1 thioesterase [Sulfitobacter sp. SK012]